MGLMVRVSVFVRFATAVVAGVLGVIMCFPLCRLGTAARGPESRHEYVHVVIHEVSRTLLHMCTTGVDK